MIITRLHLEDFGIFQQQRLENLQPGLVVIVGPNRAGKTTLMHALRCLGFGVPRGFSIPAGLKYQLNAQADAAQGRFRILLEGHSEPRVFPERAGEESEEVDIAALYGGLDAFTYRQIFTISLDELRQIPEGLSRNEQDKLAAVLLGAGWSESMKLLELKETFNAAAYQIGASRGAVGTRKFKEPYQEMEQAVRQRDRANARLDEYHREQENLQDLTGQVQAKEMRLAEARQELQKLELLERHYDRYQEIVQTRALLNEPQNKKLLEGYPAAGLQEGSILQDRYQKVLQQYREATDQFTLQTGQPVTSALYEGLLQHSGALDRLEKQLSGWREALKYLQAKKQERAEKENALAERVSRVFGELPVSEALSTVEKVKVDGLRAQELASRVDRFKKYRDELERKATEIKDLQALLQEKTVQRAGLPRPGDRLRKKVLRALGLDAAAVIVLNFLINTAVAVTVGALAGLGILCYFILQNRKDQQAEMSYRELEQEISQLEHQVRSRENRRRELAEEAAGLQQEIEEIKDRMLIPHAVQVDYLLHFMAEAEKMQQEYRGIRLLQEDLEAAEKDLEAQFRQAAGLLQAAGIFTGVETDLAAAGEILFSHLQKASRYLEAAVDVYHKESAKKEVEKEILGLLEKEAARLQPDQWGQPVGEVLEQFIARGRKHAALWERAEQGRKAEQYFMEELRGKKWQELLLGPGAKAPGPRGTDEAFFQAFGLWCEEFSRREEIEAELEKQKEAAADISREIEKLNKEIWQAENRLENLSSDQVIREAMERIREARAKLEPLAEEYAVYRLAQFMVEQTYQRLLAQTKNELLAPASAIFQRITGGAYTEVEPPQESGKPHFAVRLADGRSQEAASLSRATREQLFLAVRLSRIAAVHPPLPVILDDTLANFDPAHTRETVAFLTELSCTHQVFVFTCHPRLVECLHETSGSCQYWGLDEGRISGPYDGCREVLSFLRI